MSFQPLGDTVGINVAGTTAAAQVSTAGVSAVRVFNDGSATTWIAFGTATLTTATTTGIPIGTKQEAVFTVPAGSAVWAAAIAAGATGYIYFTPGAAG